jgi:hypothetical protein
LQQEGPDGGPHPRGAATRSSSCDERLANLVKSQDSDRSSGIPYFLPGCKLQEGFVSWLVERCAKDHLSAGKPTHSDRHSR